MKHIRYVKFMAKLWVAYDHQDREVTNGYIDEHGLVCVWDTRDVFIQGQKVSMHSIMNDVANQMEIIYHCRKKQHTT